MNYKKGETKYNYDMINKLEKELTEQEEKIKNKKAKVSIDEKWKLANIKKPDMNSFNIHKTQFQMDIESDFKREMDHFETNYLEEKEKFLEEDLFQDHLIQNYQKFS